MPQLTERLGTEKPFGVSIALLGVKSGGVNVSVEKTDSDSITGVVNVSVLGFESRSSNFLSTTAVRGVKAKAVADKLEKDDEDDRGTSGSGNGGGSPMLLRMDCCDTPEGIPGPSAPLRLDSRAVRHMGNTNGRRTDPRRGKYAIELLPFSAATDGMVGFAIEIDRGAATNEGESEP